MAKRYSGDVVGADVAEHLRPVRIRVEVEHRLRHRAEQRLYVFNLTQEALDPAQGPARIARLLAQEIYRRLTWEGWPVATQPLVSDLRPGEEGYFSG